MAISIADSTQEAICNLVADAHDAGAGANGKVKIYGDPRPANPDTAPAGTLIATNDLSDPAFGAAAPNGDDYRATANAIADDTNATAGTATWFRSEDKDDNVIITGSVGGPSSGEDMELSQVIFNGGETVQLSSYFITITQDPG